MIQIYYLLFLALLIIRYSEDDEFVKNDFKLGFHRMVSLGNKASFTFTTDSWEQVQQFVEVKRR